MRPGYGKVLKKDGTNPLTRYRLRHYLSHMNFLFLFNIILLGSALRSAWNHDKAEMLIIAVAIGVINLTGYVLGEMRDNKEH